jgi:thymidylate synthase
MSENRRYKYIDKFPEQHFTDNKNYMIEKNKQREQIQNNNVHNVANNYHLTQTCPQSKFPLLRQRIVESENKVKNLLKGNILVN